MSRESPPTAAALNRAQAERVYSRMVGLLSVVNVYERLATRRLAEQARFGEARAVYEFGCGTGHFAGEVLCRHLHPGATWKAVDVTPAMVDATRRRLARYGARVTVERSSGGAPTEPPGSCDRFISNFVLDLLPDDDIAQVLASAHRMLTDGGLLCLASLAPPHDRASRVVMRLWDAIYARAPSLLGGCRPIRLPALLAPEQWEILHDEVVSPIGVPLEVVVARKRGRP